MIARVCALAAVALASAAAQAQATTTVRLAQVSGSPFASGTHPTSVAFSPSGGLLAVTNVSSNTVSVFTVSSHGVLTGVPGSPYSTGSNTQPIAVPFNPSGSLLAVSSNGNRIYVFSVAGNGALTQVSGSSFRTGNGPYSIAFSPDGSLLATADQTISAVSVFTVIGVARV